MDPAGGKIVANARSTKSVIRPTRRQLLRSAGTLAAAAALQMPFIRPARAARSLRVATFGGDFEQSFAQHVYPAFTKATGIEVQSLERAEGTQFLFQLAQANKAGKPPMDICCAAETEVLRGRPGNLWRIYDAKRVPGLASITPRLLREGPSGPDCVAAMSWFVTLVVNPDEMKPLPDSWQVLWQKHPDAWGVNGGSQSPLFEIAAHLFFGGNDALSTKEGIDQVVAKIGEIKPNVKLWWQDEGTMQTALQNDEVIGGTYLHDVAMSMIKLGAPLRSIFPREGAMQGVSYWAQPSASTKADEAEEFMNFCCSAAAQELIVRKVGSAPVIDRGRMDLTDAEFASVSSDIPAIPMAAQARITFSAYLEQQFTKMVTS